MTSAETAPSLPTQRQFNATSDILPIMQSRTGPRPKLILALAAFGLGGCQKALFPSNEPRTQFQAHDEIRESAPIEVPDVFGNPQPALRTRLLKHG